MGMIKIKENCIYMEVPIHTQYDMYVIILLREESVQLTQMKNKTNVCSIFFTCTLTL